MLINGGILHGQGGAGNGEAVKFVNGNVLGRRAVLIGSDTNHFAYSGYVNTTDSGGTLFSLTRVFPSAFLIYLYFSSGALFFHSSLSSGAKKLWANTADIGINDGLWHHIALSISGGSSHAVTLYVDDLPVTMTKTQDLNASSSFPYTYAGSESVIGRSTRGGAGDYSGDMANVYIGNQPISFGTTAVRRTFLTDAGKPPRRNSDGSDDVTLITPLVWLTGGKNTFPINAGSGGGFTADSTFERSDNTPIIIGT